MRQQIKSAEFFKLPSGVHPRIHSQDIDKLLGFKIIKIEKKLLTKNRPYYKTPEYQARMYQATLNPCTWIGLHPQVLQTPYSEIAHFLSCFSKHIPKTVVDFGAGYGRVGVVLSSVFPDATFIGYEIVNARINEARRMFKLLALDNCTIHEQDILDPQFDIPQAEIYFIYDFSNPNDIRTLLKKLALKLFKDRFFIIARGEGVRSLIQLKFPEFWSCHGAIHKKNWSLYSSFGTNQIPSSID